MELKHECVRDVLLTIEEHINYRESYTYNEIAGQPRLKDYNLEDVLYTLDILADAKFIKIAKSAKVSGSSLMLGVKSIVNIKETENIKVISLTYEGHKLLDNIRDPKIWSETKTAAKQVAGVSLTILTDIAGSLLKEKLGIGN
ncbi:hypothetical protein B9T64_06725 [Bacillus halotolerans]|uniref:DUF2513 domain-containing protein n=1 Tax=Bacillus halotolerans TaxID=260554 RepID=UPI000BFED586|nr:DUF2513 domain-containing protein [Bacillus halotolerans]PHI49671.1 hypothetical protein B9T64_06725 [Bacillus halotolerans]